MCGSSADRNRAKRLQLLRVCIAARRSVSRTPAEVWVGITHPSGMMAELRQGMFPSPLGLVGIQSSQSFFIFFWGGGVCEHSFFPLTVPPPKEPSGRRHQAVLFLEKKAVALLRKREVERADL